MDPILFLTLFDDDKDEENTMLYESDWFTVIEDYSNLQFFEAFRMNKECFNLLVEAVGKYKQVNDIRRKCFVFIYYISNASTYRVLRNIMGISKTSIFKIVKEMSTILSEIASIEIKFPEEEELEYLSDGMRVEGFDENAVLAIDGTHINIIKPKEDGWRYYDRHGNFSLTFLCLCDFKKRFRGVTYNFGRLHDSRIYRISRLREKIESLPSGYVVLGDPVFSNFLNIRSTYSTANNPLTNEEAYNLGIRRVIVEHAFGFFKGKFNRFRNDIYGTDVEKIILIVKGAMWVHNFVIDNN